MKDLNELVGKVIKKIFINQDYLKFETDQDELIYCVQGDCCSSSYFHDFFGIKNLLGKKVTEVKEVELMPGDVLMQNNNNSRESIQVYGYQIFIESEDFGTTTAVFSFRNSSNGYYGGWIDKIDSLPNSETLKELTEDIYEVK